MKAVVQPSAPPRPPRAVVGSQISFEEEMFGAAFDGRVVRRFWGFVAPHRRGVWIGMVAVLVFTLTQVAIPLVLRYAIDDALAAGEAGLELLRHIVVAFFVVVGLNYAANFVQEFVVGRISGSLLFDLRRAMYRHLQHVSLSFMDKTEVGRLMSRLQGDVNALQEFLETSIFAIGDFVLLIGIVTVLLVLNFELGLLTLSVVLVLILVRIVWLPRAKRAFLRARETSSVVNGALAENVHGIRTIQEMGRESVNFTLFDDKAKDNLLAHLRASKFSNVMIPIVDTLTGIAMAVVIVVGGGMVLEKELEIGVMVAFLFYVQRFFDPIRSLTIQYSIMQRAMAAGQRIFEVLDVPIEVRDRPDANCAAARGARHRVRRRDLRVRTRPPGAAQCQPAGGAGGDGSPGGADRVRQDQRHRTGPPLLRRVERGGADRGIRRARRTPGRYRRARGDGAAGAFPVHGQRLRQHFATTRRRPPVRKWRPRRAQSARTTSSDAFRRATTPCSISAAGTSRSDSASS